MCVYSVRPGIKMPVPESAVGDGQQDGRGVELDALALVHHNDLGRVQNRVQPDGCDGRAGAIDARRVSVG